MSKGVLSQCLSPDGSAMHGRNHNGGTAVLGEILATTSANGIAVAGFNNSTFAGSGPGGGGFGMYGHSDKGIGLVGATGTAGGAALAGSTNGVAGAYAGLFYGPVVVVGDLTVTGAKSAAVPHPDGSHRLVYCVESPESWFEDFGSATLTCGRAEVSIDPDFAEVADLEDYHVFLTGYDHAHGLHVVNRTGQGFTVHADATLAALKGQTEEQLSGSFSWRVVARRKDIRSERLATVTIPPAPTLPDIPMTSELPAFEAIGRRR
jgi:hypothetical protein